jgi:hypothetical protein
MTRNNKEICCTVENSTETSTVKSTTTATDLSESTTERMDGSESYRETKQNAKIKNLPTKRPPICRPDEQLKNGACV